MNSLNYTQTDSMREYDSYNFLDGFVLNLLVDDKKLSNQQIFKRIQKKLPVSELTVNTCLLLMYMNGLVNVHYAGTRKIYEISNEGNDFLKSYRQIKNKILELNEDKIL
jgi:DNA-binding PadR family transcriptional regulator